MKKINEKIKKALSFLLILTMAMTSVGVSTFSAFADSEDGTGTTEAESRYGCREHRIG